MTLGVTPAEAQRLVLAERFGTLRLVLRPLNADAPIFPPQVRIDDVFRSEPTENPSPIEIQAPDQGR